MKSIIAGILRNQAEILRKGLINIPHNFHLIERVLPNAMVIKELEIMADELDSKE